MISRLEVDLAVQQLIPHAILFNRYEEVRVATTLFYFFHCSYKPTINQDKLALILNHYDRPKRGDKKSDVYWLFAFYKHSYRDIKGNAVDSNSIKLWIGFAIYISLLSYWNDNPVQAKAILKKIKIYTYTRTPNYIWFWNHEITQKIASFLPEDFDTDYLSELEIEFINRGQRLSTANYKTSGSENYTQRSRQVSQLNKIIEWAYHPERKRGGKSKKLEENTNKNNEKSKNKKTKEKLKHWFNDKAPPAPKLSPTEKIVINPHNKFYINKVKDPIHHHPAELRNFYPKAQFTAKNIDIEELVDAYMVVYLVCRPNPPIKYQTEPLQNYDSSVQQTYMACNDFELPSNPRYLSKSDYQLVFSYLVQHQQDPIASLLLFSFITGLPIETLLTTHTFSQSPLFEYQHDEYAFIVHRIGVSERREDKKGCFENKSDLVRLPLPIKLFERLLQLDIAKIKEKDIETYINKMQEHLEIVFLTHTRIEKALHIFIRRFTPTGNKHFADLICRIPVDVAPATYYSSHQNSSIVSVYKQALDTVNEHSNFDLSYFNRELIDFSTGSMQALTVAYVHKFMTTLNDWVIESVHLSELFNRYSIYVWHCLFLTTGLRPNNGIPGTIKHIDDRTGWIVVDDKPNRSSTTERIIPLCVDAKEQIKDYKHFLKHFRHHHLANSSVSSAIHHILTSVDDKVLLNLLESDFNFSLIKRGDIENKSPIDLDISPYWVRHFVRTQLEKLGTPLPLINTIIGHERRDQEGLNKFSSISKRQIYDVQHQFEKIAQSVGIKSMRKEVTQCLASLEHV